MSKLDQILTIKTASFSDAKWIVYGDGTLCFYDGKSSQGVTDPEFGKLEPERYEFTKKFFMTLAIWLVEKKDILTSDLSFTGRPLILQVDDKIIIKDLSIMDLNTRSIMEKVIPHVAPQDISFKDMYNNLIKYESEVKSVLNTSLSILPDLLLVASVCSHMIDNRNCQFIKSFF